MNGSTKTIMIACAVIGVLIFLLATSFLTEITETNTVIWESL